MTDYQTLETYLSGEKIDYVRNEPMAQYTTFKIGGEADILIFPSDEEKVRTAVLACNSVGIPFFVLGRGSNILVSDSGIRKAVISLSRLDYAYADGNDIICGAGSFLGKICSFARDNSLSGMENLYGIPGSVGGAVYMNAGAYGSEIRDVCFSVTVLDSNGYITEIDNPGCKFEYRNSAFRKSGAIVLACRFRLKPGERDIISATMTEVIEKRTSKQPLEFPSAGSTFKRPVGDYASRLIDVCNLKGLAFGGAQVSEKHAGFVINRGGASADDVLKLVEIIRETVYEKEGIMLETEIEYIE